VRRKPRVRLEAQMHGGGHERGLRSGTLATHQIVGMGEAFRLARLEMAEENKRVGALRDRLLAGLQMEKCSSTATWRTACPTTSTSASPTSKANP
jgi:cysteine sulfinate desulfinase/cysteine desulfurase-like protein